MPPSPRRQRIRRIARNLVIVLAAGCIGRNIVSYSPEEDDTAIAAIASTWSASTPALSISLCEDPTALEPDQPCQVQHMVRGEGRGRRHEEDNGSIGCGGCPFAAVAFVKGTASGAGLPGTGPVAIAGEVRLSFANPDDPYEFPYQVVLKCIDPLQPCSLFGTLQEDGTLELDSNTGDTVAPVALARTGTATCP